MNSQTEERRWDASALLRGKGDRDFDIFMKLLRKSGNEVWAGQMEEKVWLIKTDPQGGGQSTSLNR